MLSDPNYFDLIHKVQPQAIKDIENVVESYNQLLAIYKETMNNVTKEKISEPSQPLEPSGHKHIYQSKQLPKFPRLFRIEEITEKNVAPLIISVTVNKVPCKRELYIKDRSDKFRCQTCNKTFTLKSSVTRHAKTLHYKQKEHTCKFCGAIFLRLDNAKYHVIHVHKYWIRHKDN